MTVRNLIRHTQKLAIDNSPAILTAIGVTGVVTTAYLTGKATFKAAEILVREDLRRHNEATYKYEAEFSGTILKENRTKRLPHQIRSEPITTRDAFDLLWKLYVPAVLSGVGTIGCIIMANRIGNRRTAAMVTAYALTERAYSEYKEKVIETIGRNKETKIRDEVAQDRVTRNPSENAQVIITGNGEVLCMDAWSGRYFESSMEAMKKAQNDTNHEVLSQTYASLTDLYNRLGLASTKESDDVGWNSDKLLEMSFTTTMSDDQRPCIVMDFAVAPVRNFFRMH